jgi:hypothetical protein
MFRYVEERTGNPRYGEIADLFQQGLFYRGEDEEHSKVPASRGARENVSTVVRVSVKQSQSYLCTLRHRSVTDFTDLGDGGFECN